MPLLLLLLLLLLMFSLPPPCYCRILIFKITTITTTCYGWMSFVRAKRIPQLMHTDDIGVCVSYIFSTFHTPSKRQVVERKSQRRDNVSSFDSGYVCGTYSQCLQNISFAFLRRIFFSLLFYFTVNSLCHLEVFTTS